jgi:alkanesulfonate monooxygenase SsuD/methylene tetrahydromethanopterin reductase-like flavin-dependent oxidoreductase (luciferase family)
MGVAVSIMIEAQEGLTWRRWQRLARSVEAAGLQGLYRSDHLTGLFGDARRPALDTWASLAWLAAATERIRFGPLVCPLTFYHPGLLARHAFAVGDLSGGRLDLGIGAGWHDGEHRMFGIPFPSLKERLDRLECGARVIVALRQGEPVTLEQPYAPLVAAQTAPRPMTGLPLVIGGRGEKRTLRIVAQLADEWNVTRVTIEEYVRKRDLLEDYCQACGREAAHIRHAVMLPIVVGRSTAEVSKRLVAATANFPRLPTDEAGWRASDFLFGGPDRVVEDLARWAAAGVARVMLQLLDMDDLDAIELIGREVVPRLGPGP